MNGPDDSTARKVRSLRDLPQSIEPPARLWSQIELELAVAPRRNWAHYRLAASVLLALGLGVLAGHWLPSSHAPASIAQAPSRAATPTALTPVGFSSDPRYLTQRAALLSDLDARLSALPPDARQKVLNSLAGLQQSMLELQAELGRDPSNALLQELLVDTCQDEMRVLVSVHEAGAGIGQL